MCVAHALMYTRPAGQMQSNCGTWWESRIVGVEVCQCTLVSTNSSIECTRRSSIIHGSYKNLIFLATLSPYPWVWVYAKRLPQLWRWDPVRDFSPFKAVALERLACGGRQRVHVVGRQELIVLVASRDRPCARHGGGKVRGTMASLPSSRR